MVRIDGLIFGYRRIKIEPDDLSEVSSIFIRASIPSRINADGTITVRERDFFRIQGLLSGRIEFEYSEPLGLYGKFKLLPHKKIYAAAIALSVIIVVFLSSFVWDVRIEGNEMLSDADIRIGLSRCGLSVGDLWFLSDTSDIEARYLKDEERISWININRRGTVAYIKVIEKEENEETKESAGGYCNLVAAADCIIEEITVKSGIALVKPGDTVKKGDVLILGIMPEVSGGGFCEAEGSVMGRITETISVNTDRIYEKKSLNHKKLYSIDLNFFKISINIFKLYGNLTNKCDIINTEKTYSLLGRAKLPFSINLKYIPEYEGSRAEYTDEELVRIACSRLDAMMAHRLATSDLLRLKSYGEFTDSGYTVSSDITFLSDVAERIDFEID